MNNALNKPRKTVFNRIIRIRRPQLEYLRKTKQNYSMAGYLDMIINFWKDYEINFGISESKKIPARKKRN